MPRARGLVLLLVLAATLGLAAPSGAGPYVWDDDGNGIDDRAETVQLLGYRFSFVNADTTQPQRFEVSRIPGGLLFGFQVVYDADPTPADLTALTVLGLPIRHRYENVPAVRTLGTFAQAQAVVTLPHVDHVEVVPIAYGLGREESASIGAADATHQVFPTWSGLGGGDGSGIVVAILDTGINDAPEGAWPGHESLAGRVIGGASFVTGDTTLDTPRNGSINPSDHGGPATHAHGTHVAGTVLGGGGAGGIGAGVAPGARAIDVKVLSDAGSGTGLPEALDWCIHNRTRDWGAGGSLAGIDVITLALSTPDLSDGNDVASRLSARAAALGIVVVASSGNDGAAQHIPSPAAGDGVLTIAAYDAQRTGAAADDQFASFSDTGPRASDGDGDAVDEQKPDLAAPGVAVLSADGDLATDGAQYVRMSGTSMAAAVTAGAVAALRSEFPGLTPAQIADVLHATARHGLAGLPVSVPGVDPRWNSAEGWGALDLAAARLELLQPERTQVRRLILAASPESVTTTLWSMRERGATHLVLERAPDAGGAPGAFAPLDSVATAGDSSLAVGNLHAYALAQAIPPSERGATFWYRAAYTEAGQRFAGPARALALPSGPPVARIELRIVHNAYDSDVAGAIEAGGTPGSPAVSLPLPGTSQAVASDWVDGVGALGNVAWDFSIDVPAGVADAWLPPTAPNPWRLRLTEGGFLNRSGRVERFRVVWYGPQGDVTVEGGPAPAATVEGGTIELTAPYGVAGVTPAELAVPFRAMPSPVRAGDAVRFTLPASATTGSVSVFDVSGRQVARVHAEGTARTVRWEARDRTGGPLAPGLYFAHAGTAMARIVVLSR